MARKALKYCLLTYVALTFGVILWQELPVEEPATEVHWEGGDYSLVTYFHSKKRCSTCNNMENYSKEALESNFPSELASKKLRFRVLNWQAEANAAYAKRYDLLGNAVILSRIEDGKEVDFENLDEVWTHVHDKGAFIDYVSKEVRDWIGES